MEEGFSVKKGWKGLGVKEVVDHLRSCSYRGLVVYNTRQISTSRVQSSRGGKAKFLWGEKSST